MTKIRDNYPDLNPDQAIRKRINTLSKSQSSHLAGKKEVAPPLRGAQGKHLRKWTRRHKWAIRPRPQRTPTIKPGLGKWGLLGGGNIETAQEIEKVRNHEHLQGKCARG